jgi:DNA mismatch repair protein MSH4
MIDATSIRNLEIVDNLQTGTKKDTLMGIINHTQTPVGSRLLRSILLQPLTGTRNCNHVNNQRLSDN